MHVCWCMPAEIASSPSLYKIQVCSQYGYDVSKKLNFKIILRATWKNLWTVYNTGSFKIFEHLLWPPRSPDLTSCDFFLWGYVKDNAYKPPLPQNVRELQDRFRAAVQTIDGNMLKRVWQERLSY